MKTERKRFVITKRIAKHCKQSIVVIPKLLESELCPGTIVQITLEIFEK